MRGAGIVYHQFAARDERSHRLVDRLEARVTRIIPNPLATLCNRVARAANDVRAGHLGIVTREVEDPFLERLVSQAWLLSEPMVRRLGVSAKVYRLRRHGIEHLTNRCGAMLDRLNDPLRNV